MLSAKISISLQGNPHLDKQTTFALASSLTQVAQEAQTAVRDAIEGNFTIRTNWDKSGPYAVKIQPATKQNLEALVGTAADWMEKFMREDQGGIVVNLPQHGRFLAVPTKEARRTKRDLIQKRDRPRSFIGKRDVILPMKSRKGFVLFQRRGRGHNSKLVALYILTPLAHIKQKDVLFGPTIKVFEQRFPTIFEQQLQRAFATAR
jgi:hypothetical protein